MRGEDGPPGERKLCRGLRLEHLAAAAEAFDRSSERGCVEWAAVLTGHSALLRGGEFGVPDQVEAEPRRIITWRSIRWQRATRESAGRLWLMLMVVPIKDPTRRHRGYPTPITRRHDGRFGEDALCAYDAVALAWWRRRHGGAPFPLETSAAGLRRIGGCGRRCAPARHRWMRRSSRTRLGSRCARRACARLRSASPLSPASTPRSSGPSRRAWAARRTGATASAMRARASLSSAGAGSRTPP
eukprot:3866032-Prymnesium_polylepis.1